MNALKLTIAFLPVAMNVVIIAEKAATSDARASEPMVSLMRLPVDQRCRAV
jgi:hypothetical protein